VSFDVMWLAGRDNTTTGASRGVVSRASVYSFIDYEQALLDRHSRIGIFSTNSGLK